MKSLLAVALIAFAVPAAAQTAPVPAPAPAPAPAARLNLDTAIETIVADPAGKAVLTATFGEDPTTNPNYEQGKSFSINQIAQFFPDKFTPEKMKKLEADLAAIK